jgi:hypothetical protein
MSFVCTKNSGRSNATRGVVLPTSYVWRSVNMVKPNSPAPLGMAVELAIDDHKDGEVGQARPKARPEGVPLSGFGPPKEIPADSQHV